MALIISPVVRLTLLAAVWSGLYLAVGATLRGIARVRGSQWQPSRLLAGGVSTALTAVLVVIATNSVIVQNSAPSSAQELARAEASNRVIDRQRAASTGRFGHVRSLLGTEGSDKVPCEAVDAWLSPSSCNAAKAAFGATVEGRPQASVPANMFVGEPSDVTLSVGLPGAGAAAARQAVQGPGQTPVELPPGKIGRRMGAGLVGVNFDITLVSPSEAQDLAPYATWVWRVVPKAEGRQQLFLETTADFLDVDGKDYVLGRTGEHYTVHVIVRQPSLLERLRLLLTAIPTWIKMLTAIVASVTALVAAVVAVRAALRRLFGRTPPPTKRKKTSPPAAESSPQAPEKRRDGSDLVAETDAPKDAPPKSDDK